MTPNDDMARLNPYHTCMHAWLIKYMTYKDMSLPHSESLHDDSTHAWRLSGMYVNSGVVENNWFA